MTKETWDKYVNDLLNSMTRPVAETPDYDFQNIQESKSTEVKTYNERGVFQMLFGTFSIYPHYHDVYFSLRSNWPGVDKLDFRILFS